MASCDGARRAGCTIVQTAHSWHKGRCAVFAVAVALVAAAPTRAQVPARSSAVSAGQVLSIATGSAVLAVPNILGLPHGPPSCAPCERRTVPWFDRWAIGRPRPSVALASDILILGLAAGSWLDLADGTGGSRRVAISAEAAVWAWAATELAKVLVARERPVMYTAGAASVARLRDNRRSMPSGHAALAVALAVSHALQREHASGVGRVAVPLLSLQVSAFRVAAGRHFPSDVLIGAVIGAASAAVIHEVRR